MNRFRKLAIAVTLASLGMSISTMSIAQETMTQSAANAPRAADIEQLLNSALIEKYSPGLAVAVVANGKVLFSKGYGKTEIGKTTAVTADTPFYIASTTKAFTGHIAAQLASDGVISLTAPVTELMPELRFHPSIKTEAITLTSLLNHTHGIDGTGPVTIRTSFTGEFADRKQLLSLLDQHPAARNGNAFHYSNVGPILAAYILEHKTGKAWQDLIDQMIFKALPMRNSANRLSQLSHLSVALGHDLGVDGFSLSKGKKQDANMHPAGGTFSSANDLAAWVGVHMNQGKWQGKTVFPATLIDKAWIATAQQDRTVQGVKRTGWSLGWDIAEYKGQKMFTRHGGFTGYGAHVSMMPERGFGVIVLTNGGSVGSSMTQHIAETVYSFLMQEPNRLETRVKEEARLETDYPKIIQAQLVDKEKRAARQTTMPLPMENYAGVFQSQMGTLHCTIKDNRLHLQMGIAQDNAEVFSAEKHAFRTELFGSGQVLSYVFKDDKIVGVNMGGVLFSKI